MGRMLQTFQGLHVVKAYNMESHERRRFWDHTHRVYREQLKITWYEGLIRSNNEMLGIGVLCLSALAGGYLVLNQKVRILGVPLAARPMDFGQIMLFYAFLIGCTDPLRKMADVFGSLQKGAAAADRIMPFIAAAPMSRSIATRSAFAMLANPSYLNMSIFSTSDKHRYFRTYRSASNRAKRWPSSGPTAAARAR